MILYFTGTGNSRYAAEKLGAQLSDQVVDLFEKIRGKDDSPLTSERGWVVVCPTYGWQIPHILRDYLLKTELKGSKEMWFVMTCGSGIGSAGVHCERLCREKGLDYKGVKRIVMPENYIAMFNAPGREKALEIIEKADPVIEEAGRVILQGGTFPESRIFSGSIKSGIVNTVFYKHSVKDGPFRVKDGCTGCGLCASLCPLSNIDIKDGRPVWKGNCTHCMACICHCPEEAIEYGNKSKGKPRYTCPR